MIADRESVRLDLDADRTDDAVHLAHRLLGIDPYDEDAHELAITALHRAGAVEEAERAREAYRRAMADLAGDHDDAPETVG